MSTASGVVSRVYAKEWEGRDGPTTLHSFQIKGDNRYFRTGEKALVREGDTVSFGFDARGNVSDLVHVPSTQTSESRPGPGTGQVPTERPKWGGNRGGGGGYNKRPAAQSENWEARKEYWDDKEKRDIERERRQQEVVEPRITWSSAQSDAVVLVCAALEHDLLSFGNANKSAKLGLLLDYVDQVTQRFASQRLNAAELLARVSETSEDAPKDHPSSDLDQ